MIVVLLEIKVFNLSHSFIIDVITAYFPATFILVCCCITLIINFSLLDCSSLVLHYHRTLKNLNEIGEL